MAKIKILLDKGESVDQAEDLLFKALKAKLNPEESWDDPLTDAVEQEMNVIHDRIMADMVSEIFGILDD